MTQIIRQWNGRIIRQRADGYLSATDMCQTAGKLFADWNRLKSTSEYLQALSESMGFPIDQLVRVNESEGSNEERGTWVHPEVAVDLAQWLNVHLRIQVNRWIIELMTEGVVRLGTVTQQPLTYVQQTLVDVEALTSWMSSSQAEKSLLEQAKFDVVVELHPEYKSLIEAGKKVKSIESAHSAVGLTATQVGQRLSPALSPMKVNKALKAMGLLFSDRSGKKPIWQLTFEGKKHGFVYFASSGSTWSGDQIRWQDSVIHRLSEYLAN